MKISVFGLGYVGCVSVGCLASSGHQIIGVDLNKKKVSQINSGNPTIIEKDIGDIIFNQRNLKNIEATTNSIEAVQNTDVSIICVGTPSSKKGHLDFSALYSVAEDIGRALKSKKSFHTIAIRSTIMPGQCNEISNIISKHSGKKMGKDYYVLSNPEFLREGTAVEDYKNPPFILIGSENKKASKIISKMYNDINAEVIIVDVRVAELLKYVNNSFHALKVGFANEIGNICKSLDVDSHKLMEIFIKDKDLNISPYYLKPGFAYGGSCLPKDLKALKTIAYDKYLSTPIINSIEESNTFQIQRAFNIIKDIKIKKIGYLGISFKSGTDDLRNSPNVILLELLIGKGYKVHAYDRNVSSAILTGTNKEYIDSHIPHIKTILDKSIERVIKSSELIVIGNNDKLYTNYLKKYNKFIVDLVKIDSSLQSKENYIGINW
tara:strand:+ start:10727 stop:12031 length:1305 start_codon:yes stop_codon:yes gene_type:complete